MTKQFKILLATDYSEQVMNAERYALQFAKMTNSALTILHVYSVPISLPAAPSDYAHAAERLRKNELLRLEQHCAELFRSLGMSKDELQCEYLVLEGDVTSRINQEAESWHADMIITGTHAAKGFWDFFKKSHTWGLMKKSDIPVLTIPEMANLSEIRKIVLATEYREGEIPGIRFLSQLAKSFSAELVILNVTTHMLTKEFERALRNNFYRQIKDLDIGKAHFRIIHTDDIVDGINEYCENTNADWLVMTHSRSILERFVIPGRSVTKDMSSYTHVPLLAIPDFYEKGS